MCNLFELPNEAFGTILCMTVLSASPCRFCMTVADLSAPTVTHHDGVLDFAYLKLSRV